MHYLIQFFVIVASVAVVFGLSNLDLVYQIMALTLMVLWFLGRIYFRKRKNKHAEILTDAHSEVAFIFITVLLFIFITGGIKSPIFYLIYLLLFGISVMYEPVMIFVFTIASILIFLPQALTEDVLGNIIKLALLAIISPLAFFFSLNNKKKVQAYKKSKK